MDYGVKNQFYGWLGEYLLVVTNSVPLKMAHRKFVDLPNLKMVDLSMVM